MQTASFAGHRTSFFGAHWSHFFGLRLRLRLRLSLFLRLSLLNLIEESEESWIDRPSLSGALLIGDVADFDAIFRLNPRCYWFVSGINVACGSSAKLARVQVDVSSINRHDRVFKALLDSEGRQTLQTGSKQGEAAFGHLL